MTNPVERIDVDAAAPTPDTAAPAADATTTTTAATAAPSLGTAPSLGAALTLLAAVGLFVVVARRVATKEAEPVDQALRTWAQEHRAHAGDLAVKPVTLVSMPAVVLSATAALVWWLHRTGRRDAAVALAVAPLMAMTAGASFSTFLHQRNPPDAGDALDGEVKEPSFPSGHTAGVTAETLSVAYILSREGLISPGVLAALLGWPVILGVTRVYRDRHWLSDVLGGWAAGTAVAATSALLYDGLRASREPGAR